MVCGASGRKPGPSIVAAGWFAGATRSLSFQPSTSSQPRLPPSPCPAIVFSHPKVSIYKVRRPLALLDSVLRPLVAPAAGCLLLVPSTFLPCPRPSRLGRSCVTRPGGKIILRRLPSWRSMPLFLRHAQPKRSADPPLSSPPCLAPLPLPRHGNEGQSTQTGHRPPTRGPKGLLRFPPLCPNKFGLNKHTEDKWYGSAPGKGNTRRVSRRVSQGPPPPAPSSPYIVYTRKVLLLPTHVTAGTPPPHPSSTAPPPPLGTYNAGRFKARWARP